MALNKPYYRIFRPGINIMRLIIQLDMQGILKGNENPVTDRQLLDEYLQEKYGV